MSALVVGAMSSGNAALARQPRPDPEPEPRVIRYVPYEIVVFPHDPFHSPSIAERMREDGFVVLGVGAISGMILATTAPVPGIEEIMCEYMRLWPEVKAAERSVAGDALSMQPEVCPPLGGYTPNHCNQAFSTGQIQTGCGTPPTGHPNDPTFCYQWGLHNTGQDVVDLDQWRDATGSIPPLPLEHYCWNQTAVPGIDINLLPAWQRTTGSPLVTVAVLDSGIEDCNPDFDPDRFLGDGLAYNCPGNDNYANLCCTSTPCNFLPATDNLGHGTFIAGIIGAVANNGIGMTGIDQQCKLLAVRVLTNSSFPPQTPIEVTYGRVILALEEIYENPDFKSVRVINCSFRLPNIPPASEGPAEHMVALEYAVSMLAWDNRFVVAGAGNSGPAEASAIQAMGLAITVGGIDARGRRFIHPHYPTFLHSSYGPSLDFMAPGMAEIGLTCQRNQCSTLPLASGCPYQMVPCDYAGRNNFLTGTSFAAPKVCAAISLILAHAIDCGVVNPTTWEGLTFSDMYEILVAGCRDQVSHHCDGCEDVLDTVGHDNYYGWGLIDIDASLQYLEEEFCP